MRPPRFARPAALAALLLVAIPASAVHAQWTVTYLHPPGDAAGASFVFGASDTQQVGSTEPSGGVIGTTPTYASVWNGSADSWVNLHPGGDSWNGSMALGAASHQQVGYVVHFNPTGPGWQQRACLWRDTAESFVLLADVGSSAVATSGANQVGWDSAGGSSSHATLWSGTPESRVDLHPAGAAASGALGIFGTQQVGFADGHAGLWNGDPESWVDLHPAGAASSVAVGTTGAQQGGEAMVAGSRHASLWSGTAASWVDLNPAGASESSVSAVFGDWQTGNASFSDGSHASVWSGTAESWEDLSLSLAGSWVETSATGVWSDGSRLTVGGHGFNLDTGRYEALLWSRSIPEPSSMALLGLGGWAAVRRRRFHHAG